MGFINGKTYRFINNYYDGHALNVYGTNAASTGRNVCLYKNSLSDVMQDWVVKEKDGGYRLHSSVDQDYVLDRSDGTLSNSYNNNAHLCATSQTSTADSRVKFEKVSDNVYRIYLPGKDLYLTATNTTLVNNLPASSIKNATALKGGTGGQSNVYWAKKSSSKKQEWIVSPEVDSGSEPDPVPDPDPSGDGQYLIMPINQSNITVGYKNNAPAYHEQFPNAPTHYAIDMTGTPRDFYASGDGEIVGYSETNAGALGKWLAVRYDNVIDINGNRIGSVILRYCHLDDIYKTSGDVHFYDTKAMARYGNSGTVSPHLHVEVDTNVDAPNKTPTLSYASNGLEPATKDTTIDPFSVFYRKTSKPEEQTVTPKQSYCDIPNCQTCASLYPQYGEGKVPYINVTQCRNVPIYPEN